MSYGKRHTERHADLILAAFRKPSQLPRLYRDCWRLVGKRIRREHGVYWLEFGK